MMHMNYISLAAVASMFGGAPSAGPRVSDFHPRNRGSRNYAFRRPIFTGAGVYRRPGRAEFKERRRQLREVTRWAGTKPGQRGENPPFTGRRHRKAA